MSSTRALPFLKIVGTGNDFLFIDLRQQGLGTYTSLSRSDVAARIAHRQTGVGADGVVFVERAVTDSVPLKWDFYNSDGSSAAMCGNALRCMGRWGKSVLSQDETTFETVKGSVTVRKEGGEFLATLGFLRLEPREVRYGASKSATFLDTGVPHMVVSIPDIKQAPARLEDIRALRFHPEAGAAGANVTFLQIKAPGHFSTVTFERGVEGFTLSCGTGVLAAAAVGMNVSEARPPQQPVEARVTAPGGDLRVIFGSSLRSTTLIGPAEVICSGEIEKGVLQ